MLQLFQSLVQEQHNNHINSTHNFPNFCSHNTEENAPEGSQEAQVQMDPMSVSPAITEMNIEHKVSLDIRIIRTMTTFPPAYLNIPI